jgi:hypothetical protein
MFCNHDWTPRTGMDSGSFCSQCGKITEKEINISLSSGLNNGTLEKNNCFLKIFPFNLFNKNKSEEYKTKYKY